MAYGPIEKYQKVIGIDPGSYECGLSFFEEGELKATFTVLCEESDPFARRSEMISKLIPTLTYADLIVCEEPFLRGPSNQTMQRFLGMIELLFQEKLKFIAPMTVKKFTGSGSHDKIQVARGVTKFLSTKEELALLDGLILEERWNETDAVAIPLAWLSKQLEKENEMAAKKKSKISMSPKMAKKGKSKSGSKGGKGKSAAKGAMLSGYSC